MAVVISVVIGYVLDMLFGTPRILKRLKLFLIKVLRLLYSEINNKLAILVTIIIGVGVSWVVYYGCMYLDKFNLLYTIIFESAICYLCISCKEIKVNSERVHRALKRGYIKNATKLFKTITDNGEINEPRGIAENIIVMITEESIDKVITPIIYIIAFGGVGGVAYRVISIISDATGQKFAKIVKNLSEVIPTRIATIFMFISVLLLKMNFKNSLKIFKRDRYSVKSLNRGLLISLCAGALDIKLHLRKTGTEVGDSNKIITHNDITKAFEIINISCLLTLVTLSVIRILIVVFAV